VVIYSEINSLGDFMDFHLPIYLETKASLIPPNDEVAAKLHTKDLMYVKLELCHANINRNKDQFLSEELEKSCKTIIDKPINWEHTSEIIGHIYNSEFVKYDKESAADVDIKTDKIVAEGVIYKYKSPSRAKEIAKRYDKNDLFFSMETYFEKAQCSVCNQEFESEKDYCSHLLGRYDHGSEATRKLIGNLFSGVGCVGNPADDARGLAIASQRHNRIKTLMDVFGDRFSVQDYLKFFLEIKR
jgi:hypothetical protein